ncbi:MAG: class I mannose-6-phosphate isomerase [Oscillospiraceae bacterium]|jgi:mannose-6-phosphate isomerase|nr:class I mannose-6-phosphate isomerase [Oscillospiraceae bacterium]
MIIQLEENRVWRLYRGGKLLDELHGREGADGSFPEDWLASVVQAINPPREGAPAHEGLSRAVLPGGGTAYLRDLIDTPFGVLTKFLDSAERLPIQVHPDKETARRLFRSEYGKTEAWYILGGREIAGEAPYILMGFKENVTPDILKDLFERQDIGGMAALLHKIPVRPGEVYLIRGGCPHAIGSGVLLLEIQEPTDFTISLETRDTRGNQVPEQLIHQGLGFERMFECFHYDAQALGELLASARMEPKALSPGYEELISYDDTPCFCLRRMEVSGVREQPAGDLPYTLAVTKGEGIVGGIPVRQGDCLFVSAGQEAYEITGTMEILQCLPPREAAKEGL